MLSNSTSLPIWTRPRRRPANSPRPQTQGRGYVCLYVHDGDQPPRRVGRIYEDVEGTLRAGLLDPECDPTLRAVLVLPCLIGEGRASNT